MRGRHWLSGLVAAIVAAVMLTASAAGEKAAPSAAELDKLLAPIALYPDQLLAPMLVCAGNPAKVGALHEWLASQTAKGTELQDAAVASGFDESFAALVLFPDVIAYMSGQPDWTRKVGQAFISDKSAVFASIQRLRAKAQKAGNLKTTPQQEVETKTTSGGDQVIVIEPANPQVVYVPQYNPQVVYVEQSSNTGAAVAGIIGFTAGIAIGAAIDNDHYGPYGWHGAYMYNDGWDDWYDAREDAREDWQDHREDLVDERSDRAKNAQEQRTDRANTAQQQRTERQGTQSATQQRTERSSTTVASQETRGYGDAKTTRERSGTSSDAFSGYGSGKSERAASSRGQSSRSSSRSSGSRRR